MSYKLKILKCDDPKLWYYDLIGSYVPYLGQWDTEYKSRDNGGYINIVKLDDAEIVEIKE